MRYDDNKENSSCELLSVYIRFQFFIGFLYDDSDDYDDDDYELRKGDEIERKVPRLYMWRRMLTNIDEKGSIK